MSSGNAAQALALAARIFACPCTVVTFPDAAANKLASVRALGADIVFGGNTSSQLAATCHELCEQHGLQFVHPFDDPDVIAGHASMALELHETEEALDAILVPASGGGLLSATALAFKHLAPTTKVFGVQPEDACGIHKSFVAGKILSHEPNTIADGLRAQSPGIHNFALIQQHVDDILLVSEQSILRAMALAWDTLRILIEPSAAVGIALLMIDDRFRDMRVGVITTGCNVEPAMLVEARKSLS
jgi:threonine dehydratase